jgi:hypothetical protein
MSFLQRLKTTSKNIVVEHLPHNPNFTKLTIHSNKGRTTKHYHQNDATIVLLSTMPTTIKTSFLFVFSMICECNT